MSPESSFSCKHIPEKREKGIVERLDEFTTFREKSLEKLHDKRNQEQADILKETRLACAWERAEFVKNDFTDVDLSKLWALQGSIGRWSSVRKLVFGTSQDIVVSKGILGTMDQQVLESCNRTHSNTPLCKEIRGKKREKIKLSGVAPVNFRSALDGLWWQKMQDRSNDTTLPEIRAFYETHVRPFTSGEKNFTKISRMDYEKEVRDSIRTVRQNSNMDKWFSAYGINSPVGVELAKAFADKVSEADLIALGITELMDRNSPEFNSAILTTLLEKAGKEYLLFAPALGDNLLSYGPYQITKSAVNGKNGGATMADDRFTGGKMLKTRDITKFPLGDHHKAAYLLALTNVAFLVKAIPQEHVVISGKWKQKKKTVYDLQKICLDLVKKGDKDMLNIFVGFIAGAHNRQDVAKKWVVNFLIARSVGGKYVSSWGYLSDYFPLDAPPTVGNNSGKQSGEKKKWKMVVSGNHQLVQSSLSIDPDKHAGKGSGERRDHWVIVSLLENR